MRKLLLSLMLALAFFSLANAQPDTLWTRHYGSPLVDWCTSMVTTTDGGFALGNYAVKDSGGFTLFSLFKANANGDSLWRKFYGMNIVDHTCLDLKQTADGGYILIGYAGEDPDEQSCALKTNAGGDSVWMQYYGGPSNEDFQSVVQINDGGFICAGSSNSTGNQQTYLVRLDANGNTVWTRYYGDANQQTATCIIPTSDGNFMVGGYTLIPSPYGYSPFLLKVNASGDSLWQGTYPSANAQIMDLKQTTDGGYVMALMKFVSWQFDAAGMKVDANGVQQWVTSLGGQQFDSVIQSADGNYVFVGNYSTMAPPQATYMAKLSATGTQIWTLQLEMCTSLEWGQTVVQLPAGNFVIAGTDVIGGVSNQMYLVKFAPEAVPTLDVNIIAVNPPIVIPANGGSFQYNLNVHNLGTVPATFSVWTKIRSGSTYYPGFGPATRTLPGGANPTRTLTQTVAATIPAGTDYYIAYIGTYPSTIVDSSYFTFRKTAVVDGGPWITESKLYGDFFEEYAVETVIPDVYILGSASPNPFNPTTNIRYELREASYVNLAVFDISGKLIATLVDGMRQAGNQEVTFDASNLASGIYLYRISSGNFSTTGKMVLLK
ncbi:MAG: T9SS type A sorting domain-containing protein [bacterium]|nr:T9SS type A sorting domain-containing protein [bacterium]